MINQSRIQSVLINKTWFIKMKLTCNNTLCSYLKSWIRPRRDTVWRIFILNQGARSCRDTVWPDFFLKSWVKPHDSCDMRDNLSRISIVGKGSWKVRNEIGKIEVGQFGSTLESSGWSWKLSNCSETLQLQKKLSNFAKFFPTSHGSFQLRTVLSNFTRSY